MDFIVLDKNEEVKMVLSDEGYENATVISAKSKETLGQLSSLEMEIKLNLDTRWHIIEENIIGFSHRGSDGYSFYIIKEVEYVDSPYNNSIKIYCEDYAIELADSICRIEYQNTTKSVPTMITEILSGTRWQLNTSKVDNPTIIKFPESTKDKTTLEVLQTIAKVYGLNFATDVWYYDKKINEKYVIMKKEIGVDNSIIFEYDHNLLNIERTVNSSGVKTAIIPVGGVPEGAKEGTPPIDIKSVVWTKPTNPVNKPSGQAWIVDETANNLWGYKNPAGGTNIPRYVFYQNDKILSPAQLANEAWKVLQTMNAPTITFKFKVADLFAISGYDYSDSFSYLNINIGDVVTILDRTSIFVQKTKAYVTSREVDLLNIKSMQVEVGTIAKSIVSTTSNLAGSSGSSGNVMKMSAEVAQLVRDVKAVSGEVAIIGTATIGTARIEDASITNAKILDGSISNAKIDRLSADRVVINTADIADASITNAKIDRVSANKLVVNSADIADASITNAKIADASIDSVKIQDATITNAKIDRVSANKLVVTNADIADATIGTAKIETGAITNALISNGAVQNAQIADGSITDAKIVSLTANKITAGTIDAANINVTNLNADNLTVGKINGTQIANNTIATDNIADGAVTNRVISANTITGDKLVVDAITAREIASKTITANEILANTITGGEVSADTITANNIAPNTITANEIASKTITANEIATGAITADKLVVGSGNVGVGNLCKGKNWYSPSANYVKTLAVSASAGATTLTFNNVTTVLIGTVVVIGSEKKVISAINGNVVTLNSALINSYAVNTSVTLVNTCLLEDDNKTVGSTYFAFGTGNGSNNAFEDAFIQVDLGSTYRIAESRAYFFSGEVNRHYYYKIKYSVDGTSWYYAVGNESTSGWVTSAQPISIEQSACTPTVNTFTVPIVARYVRLYANGNTTNGGNHIYEWELFSGQQTIIDGGQIKTGTITADKISGGLLTGTTLRTSNTENYIHMQDQHIEFKRAGKTTMTIGHTPVGAYEWSSFLNFYNSAGEKTGFLGSSSGGSMFVGGNFNFLNDTRFDQNIYINGNPVVDYGSNANGSYVRYYDGTQICWNKVIVGTFTATNQVVNAVYGGTTYNSTFPVAFSSSSIVVNTNAGSTGYLNSMCAGVTTTAVNMRVWSPYSTTHSSMYYEYIAMGRWK
ncbi:phage tail protein [Clostridium sporogenes]|uniref:phage tail spike protein n=1 Tax=Clostridium sporogenes TaxID=1509 RepID=UPI002237B430|nr:phage tail spike protein [Clostridium sporogenes]MCW6094543.1 phage tail protein [Clostridium sporogenes]